MDQSITARLSTLKNPLVTKAPKVRDDALQHGGTLAQRLNDDKPRWSNQVTGLGADYQLC